ncbi:hypothetical protein L5164_003779 [Vibrio parahaemolyticus]|nr:hypothetical protein [Vibrio parahaemolyticus]
MNNNINYAYLKASLLSNGVRVSELAKEKYGEPFLVKRRAYGISDPLEYNEIDLPQEMYLNSDIICAVNIRTDSPWKLDYIDEEFKIINDDGYSFDVDFPRTPEFYSKKLSNGKLCNTIATLYGGSALGIFVNSKCHLVESKNACKYCSIKVNHDQGVDFVSLVKPIEIYEAVKLSLQSQSPIKQVMINGGNFPNPDKGFEIYIECCKMARKAIDELCSDIELHLIAYPPNRLELIDQLAEYNVSIALNSEVYNDKLFNSYCPGKDKHKINLALDHAVQVLGEQKVYSIMVGGLEPNESLELGLNDLISRNIIPVVNIFHPDPNTDLEHYKSPRTDDIIDMGKKLQECYSKIKVKSPFYQYCGRNSIDYEASLNLF